MIIQSDERSRGKWPLGVVEELYKSRDGIVRAVKLRAGKALLVRVVNHSYLLELLFDGSVEEALVQLNPTAPTFRLTQDAAVAAPKRV